MRSDEPQAHLIRIGTLMAQLVRDLKAKYQDADADGVLRRVLAEPSWWAPAVSWVWEADCPIWRSSSDCRLLRAAVDLPRLAGAVAPVTSTDTGAGSMRIATWNCYRGDPIEQVQHLGHLGCDLIALQECSRLTRDRDGALWRGGSEQQGLALVAGGGVAIRMAEAITDAPCALPAVAAIDEPFNVLVVWAMDRPTYAGNVRDVLRAYREFIASRPTVVLGDFNSNAQWDGKGRRYDHSALVRELSDECQLTSAYHAHTGEAQGQETQPTLYWRFQQESAFHIDYCFIPTGWRSRLRSVEVGSFEDDEGLSDHRPLVVDLDMAGALSQANSV